MNPLIAILLILVFALLLLLGLAFFALLINSFLALLGKIFKTNIKIKHSHASVYSEDRLNEDHVRYRGRYSSGW